MLYRLRAVRADRREDRSQAMASFWMRYSDVLRLVAEQPRAFDLDSAIVAGR